MQDEASQEDIDALLYLVDHRPEQRSADGHLQMSFEEWQRRDARYRDALNKIANRPSIQRLMRRQWRGF